MGRRLCDKDELIAAFNTSEYGKPERAEEWTFPNKLAVQIVEDMPEVDAVEVVRCKDCIYAQDSDDDDVQYNIGRICTCAVNEDYVSMRWADDFCSYGERKEDDD